VKRSFYREEACWEPAKERPKGAEIEREKASEPLHVGVCIQIESYFAYNF